jgi:hypothetical protein
MGTHKLFLYLSALIEISSDTQNLSVRNNELTSEQPERDAEDNISVNLASLSLIEWLIFFFLLLGKSKDW